MGGPRAGWLGEMRTNALPAATPRPLRRAFANGLAAAAMPCASATAVQLVMTRGSSIASSIAAGRRNQARTARIRRNRIAASSRIGG